MDNEKQIKKNIIIYLCYIYIFTAFNTVYAENQTSPSRHNKKSVAQHEVSRSLKTIKTIPISPKLRKKITKLLETNGKKNVVVQFLRHPTTKENTELEKLGIKLKIHTGSFRWRVSLSNTQTLNFDDPKVIKDNQVFGLIRSMNEIKPQDKILSQLLTEGVFPKHRHEDGTIEVYVGFYRDISKNILESSLARHNAKRIGKIGALNNTTIRIPVDNLLTLATEDSVRWIELIGLGDSGSNFFSQTDINSIPLHDFPYNLSGTDVKVGIWDEGLVDASHGDLTGRVTPGSGEPTTVANHATHVAGTLAGDGSGNLQWQGVAPNTDLYSFSIIEDDAEAEEHKNAINDNSIDMANNSWGFTPTCFTVGYYLDRSHAFDQLVHGNYPGLPPEYPGLPIVFAAGNNGPAGVSNCAGISNTAGTLRQPGASAKNPIVVGNVETVSKNIAQHSSRGPTYYGMLKPDVVAPGCSGSSCNKSCSGLACSTCPSTATGVCAAGITSTVQSNTYDIYAGTSMAAPAVTGTMALMLEQHRITTGGSASLLPSTFKAILTHTAEDIPPLGPDYESGYGLINALKAVELVKQQRFAEGQLLKPDVPGTYNADVYNIPVTAGDTELRVTLAWDDFPSDVSGGLASVENQLDLLVISPSLNQFYSPWQTEPSSRTTSFLLFPKASEAETDSLREIENIVEQVLIPSPAAGTWKIKVKVKHGNMRPESTVQKYSLAAGSTQNQKLIGPEVDIMQVLDRSGSMNAIATDSDDTKLQRLKTVAKDFIDLIADEVHKVGLVQFNENVVPFPATATPPPYSDADMQLASLDPTRIDKLKHAIDDITAGGLTSIGDGLEAARLQLTSPSSIVGNSHRVILLVTDGKENASQLIADVEDELITEGIRVYPLGLVYGDANIYGDRLSDLAGNTGGSYTIVNENNPFEKAYLETLAQTLNWSVSGDPVFEIGKGETVTIAVPVAHDETAAIFTSFWQDLNNSIDMSLIIPSDDLNAPNNLITSSTTDNTIRYGGDNRYAFFKINLPWENHLKEDWVGTWYIRLTGKDNIPAGQKVRVAATGFVKGGAHLDTNFDEAIYQTGDTVVATAKLKRNHRSITGSKVELQCDIPTSSSGNVLHNGQVNPRSLMSNVKISGDKINLIDQKLRLLEDAAGKKLLTRDGLKIELFDDGNHGDNRSGDGIYANSFSNTQVPGDYSCRFLATNVDTGEALKTQREWTIAFHNKVAINPEFSDIDVKLIKHVTVGTSHTPAGYYYNVTVVPRDRFGNYLGPGYPVNVSWNQTGSKSKTLADPTVSGIHQGNIFLKNTQADKNTRLNITVQDKTFTDVKPPGLSPWSYSFHAGNSSPQGNFSQSYDSGPSFTLDLEYHFNKKHSIVGLFGYHQFDSKIPSVVDNDWIHISANYQYHFNTTPIKTYIRGGAGYYEPNNGSGDFGANAGLGLEYEANPALSVQFGVDLHRVFNATDTEFLDTHIGIVKKF